MKMAKRVAALSIKGKIGTAGLKKTALGLVILAQAEIQKGA